MSRTKENISLSDKNWLTMEEAMAYVNRSERCFQEEFGCKVNIYQGAGQQKLFKKSELDYFQSRMLLIKRGNFN